MQYVSIFVFSMVVLGCSDSIYGQPTTQMMMMTSELVAPSSTLLKREASEQKKEDASTEEDEPEYLVHLVEENDEARKRYFERKEKALYESYNGANGGPMHPPEDRRRRQSAYSHLAGVVYAPVATPASSPAAVDPVQAAREKYRQDRFQGSSILKALSLANAKPQAVVSGGSYSG